MKRNEMKTISKIQKILTGIVAMFILLGSYVYASSFKFNVYATKTTVKPGEETTIVMKISDIVDVNDLGINALESVLEYDTNIFEVITTNDMEGKNNWTITYNAKEGNFLASNIISGIKTEQQIGEIKFKVKKNVEKTRTVIKFKNVKSNDGNNLMYEDDKEVEIVIDWDEETNKQSVVQIQNKDKSATGTIPQTGDTLKGTIIAASLVGITIISYLGYKKTKID